MLTLRQINDKYKKIKHLFLRVKICFSINTPNIRRRNKTKRNKPKGLQKAFDHLPKAYKDYDIFQFNVISEEEKSTKIEDQIDLDSHAKQKQKKLEEIQQTQVIKRFLCLPKKVTKIRTFHNSKNKFLNIAAQLIKKEMIILMKHDNEFFLENLSSSKKHKKLLPFEFSEKILKKAKEILNEESLKIQAGKKSMKLQEFSLFSEKSNSECFYFPHRDQFDFLKNYSIKERLDALRQEFSLLRKNLIFKMRKKYRLEKNLKIILFSYMKNVEKSKLFIKKYFHEYIKYESDIKVFETLKKIEQKAILLRFNRWKELIKLARDHEYKIQSRYQYFVNEINNLNEMLDN